ncbi:universal stress protein [Glycomyces albidus]|uniref:Universal stress protein n=1 Tax=Glycomyces albidus TaxID=2656774 RepID=A0A6L5GE20_9ACTN|nr:universal stress protein [Glycomyces albidus]MQM27942.1 universal stress protein [Glycomyces albidus]
MDASDEEQHRGRIVVGVDGSPSSILALRWALKQAEATGAEVEAVHAWEFPISFGTPVALLPGEDIAAEASTALAAAIGKVTAGDSGVTVHRRVVMGDPAGVLLSKAKDADLLVVGSRGYGAFARSLLGSVSQRCAQHAACPVVVVRSAEG